MLKRTVLSLLIVSACTRASAPEPEPAPAPAAPGAVAKDVIADAKAKLVAKHGAASTERIGKGVDQAAALWRADDGDFVAFCLAQFVADPKERDALFARMEATVEQIHGHFIELGRTRSMDETLPTHGLAVKPLATISRSIALPSLDGELIWFMLPLVVNGVLPELA